MHSLLRKILDAPPGFGWEEFQDLHIHSFDILVQFQISKACVIVKQGIKHSQLLDLHTECPRNNLMLRMSLHNAVGTNNIEEVQELLQKHGVDVNVRDSFGNTPLHLTKDKSVASLLLSAGAQPNLQNAEGDTALNSWHVLNLENFACFTSSSDQLEITGLFSDHQKLLDIISLLLEAGASPNIQNKHGYNSLHSLFVYGGAAGLNLEPVLIHDFMSLLLRFNVDVNMVDYEQCTPLHHAVKEPHITNAEVLISSGAYVDAQDYRGMTPLQHLFYSDSTEMIQLLLRSSASVNLQDMDGRTTLSSAAEVGNEPVVQLLLQDSSTCVNLADKNGVTPLHLAAGFKHVNLTEMLIRASADLNACDVLNATPLHFAAYGGTTEIITLLLEAGADAKLTDNAGWLPAQYALSRHYYHTTLKFGEEYCHDIVKNVLNHTKINQSTTADDIIVQSLPADDIFTMIIPASKVYSNAFDSSIVPQDLGDYMNTKSAGNVLGYLHSMRFVPGVGRIPTHIAEVENMKQSIEEFMSKWVEKIAEIDDRFKGTLLQSGSVYEGTKVGDPDEFDYMLCLERLAHVCSIIFDQDAKYDEITVHKRVDESLKGGYQNLFDGEQLESGKVMSVFVDVAKRALTLLDQTTLAREMYVESLTEHTLVDDSWTLSGTVTCNLKFKWTGLFYKQLVISVDLVPAIPVHHWPEMAREVGSLLMEDIKSRGCHLVPKAGYWRLSFSLAERLMMSSLSPEQKSAFIGAKVMLHPAVSCKIVIYDDCQISDDAEIGLEDDGHIGAACYATDDLNQNVRKFQNVKEGATDVTDDETMKMMQDHEELDHDAHNSDSRSLHEEHKFSSFSFPATIVGKTVLSQSGDINTVLKLPSAQDSKMLQKWMQSNTNRATIDLPTDPTQKFVEHEEAADTSEDGSDVPVKTLLPFDILSTYLLKNLFFNCIEENKKDTTGKTVATGEIFNKLFESLSESCPIPYFFIPGQNFVGLERLTNHHERSELVLVAMVINCLVNGTCLDVSKTG